MAIKYKYFDDSWININLDSWIEHFFNLEEKMTKELLNHGDHGYTEEIRLFLKEKKIAYSVEYTYNLNEIFDKSFQHWTFEIEGKLYIIIQNHLGGDARSGFYAPKIYSINSEFEYCEIPLNFNTIEFICSECEELYQLDNCGYMHPKLKGEKQMCCGKMLTPIFDE